MSPGRCRKVDPRNSVLPPRLMIIITPPNTIPGFSMSFGPKTGYRDGGTRGGQDRFKWEDVKDGAYCPCDL